MREEEEDCAQNQQSAQKEGSDCKVAKREHVCKLEMKVNEVVDGPDHCIHCDEEPCVFIQIESRLCENDKVYFHEEDYAKDHVAYNSGRRKRAYQHAAFVLWEGISYQLVSMSRTKRVMSMDHRWSKIKVTVIN
jgi:hypothetical protein